MAVKDARNEALRQRDYGDEVEPGVFIRDLGTHKETPKPSEVETVEHPGERMGVDRRTRKTLAQREDLVLTMAAQIMDWYIANLNDKMHLNPLRDGLPRCEKHPEWCSYGCRTGILPRKLDHTLGDVFTWTREVVAHNYEAMLRRRPELRGRGTILQ